jgi:hypothetical protein
MHSGNMTLIATGKQGSAPAPALTPVVSPVPPPAPKQVSVPPIDSLPGASDEKHLTDKGKQPNQGTHRSREDSPGAKSGRKKHKVSKPLSKAILSNTKDKD